jgi:predicted transcriptional regulator
MPTWKSSLLAGLLALTVPLGAHAELPVGQVPPKVTLDGDFGGLVSGGPWNSTDNTGFVRILFYVDPDESDTNDAASAALDQADLNPDKVRSYAVINMAATWLPDSLIQGMLETRQEEFPHTTFVMDFEKILVNQWNLADDSSNVLVFDADGAVLFSVDGQLNDTQVQELVATVQRATQ